MSPITTDPLSADFYDAFVRRVIAAIDATPSDAVPDEDALACVLGLPVVYFRRCLMRATGMSATCLIHWRRAYPPPSSGVDEADVYISAALPMEHRRRRFGSSLFDSPKP